MCESACGCVVDNEERDNGVLEGQKQIFAIS